MRRVILESPYKGQTVQETVANIDYARRCICDCLARKEAPIASHLLFTQEGILRDDDPQQRELGINAGLAWQTVADAVVVYQDRGISPGMDLAIDRAKFYNITVEYRRLRPHTEKGA
jgi:hypothetical protein